jgi:hypothetical protein
MKLQSNGFITRAYSTVRDFLVLVPFAALGLAAKYLGVLLLLVVVAAITTGTMLGSEKTMYT